MIHIPNGELLFLLRIKLTLLMYFWKYQIDRHISRMCKISRKLQVGQEIWSLCTMERLGHMNFSYACWQSVFTENKVESSPNPGSHEHIKAVCGLCLPTTLQMSASPFHWWPSAEVKSEKFQSLAMPANHHCLCNSYCRQCLMKLFFDRILGMTNMRKRSSWRKQCRRNGNTFGKEKKKKIACFVRWNHSSPISMWMYR